MKDCVFEDHSDEKRIGGWVQFVMEKDAAVAFIVALEACKRMVSLSEMKDVKWFVLLADPRTEIELKSGIIGWKKERQNKDKSQGGQECHAILMKAP